MAQKNFHYNRPRPRSAQRHNRSLENLVKKRFQTERRGKKLLEEEEETTKERTKYYSTLPKKWHTPNNEFSNKINPKVFGNLKDQQ